MTTQEIEKKLSLGAKGTVKITVHKPDAFVTRSTTEQVGKLVIDGRVHKELLARANGQLTDKKCQGCGN